MKLSPSLRATGRVCVFLAIIGLIFFTYYYYEFLTTGVRYVREVDGGPLIKKVTPILKLIMSAVRGYFLVWFSSWRMALMWCVVNGLFGIVSFNWLRKGRIRDVFFMLLVGIAASLVGMAGATLIEMRYQEIFCGRPSHIYVPRPSPEMPRFYTLPPEERMLTRP